MQGNLVAIVTEWCHH